MVETTFVLVKAARSLNNAVVKTANYGLLSNRLSLSDKKFK
ncbi:hypothetical protein VCRA2119O147_1260002 [Vibrio crassostreae]|nr:hypothetical protein VCRA2113O196_10198 [Vibrio crassostreae]CAK1864268.1 hypothetical protein VCRA2113O138_10371 [Vibrio crassostreae]CAK1869744.1 hypothetical protein VCRA2110O178_10281 [Vibrio crassostreae]CAK1880487.1 hypothetical protein VCRA2113O200_10481 [Vibrio crassostreae]CAK1889144.1 hypothetical protein VCRA2113O193_10482 [Vibrio crassostreae]